MRLFQLISKIRSACMKATSDNEVRLLRRDFDAEIDAAASSPVRFPPEDETWPEEDRCQATYDVLCGIFEARQEELKAKGLQSVTPQTEEEESDDE